MGLDSDPSLEDTEASLVDWMWAEVSSSYLNIGLTVAIMCLVYKIIKQNNSVDPPPPPDPLPPPLKKQDMTLAELRKYDGLSSESEERICVAVNGKVFDVTKGKRFYGPGGPYSGFAGRDASRGLATFSVEPVSDQFDDLLDLKSGELDQVKEWELQFSEKYTLVGKLLKPGEEPTSYSDEESEGSEHEHGESKSKDD